MSLNEIMGTPKQLTYYPVNTNVSPDLIKAVEQVKAAQSGTLISRAAKTTPIYSAPPAATSSIIDMIGAGSKIMLGTREEKVAAVTEFLPVSIETTPAYDISMEAEPETTTKTFQDTILDIINKQKEDNPENEDYWKQNTLANTDIKIPDLTLDLPDVGDWFKDVPKYLLIGALAIGGLYLAGRYLGKK